MTTPLDKHIETLRRALLDRDGPTADAERDWLMGEIAAALLEQDEQAMNELRSHLADLAPLADEYGEAKPGDRWRAAWELLHAFCKTVRPLQQARLAAPGQLSGLLLRHIRDTPGITPTALAERVQKKINHISNTLKTLAEQGLVHRIPQGRANCYYLAEMGREALAQQQPVTAAVKTEQRQAAKVIVFDHVREGRLQGRDPRKLPAPWSSKHSAMALH